MSQDKIENLKYHDYRSYEFFNSLSGITYQENPQENFLAAFHEIEARLEAEYAHDIIALEYRKQLLATLSEFALGKFLIISRSLNIAHLQELCEPHKDAKTINWLHDWLLHKAPLAIAMQERLQLSKKAIKKIVKNGGRNILFTPARLAEKMLDINANDLIATLVDTEQESIETTKQSLATKSIEVFTKNISPLRMRYQNAFDVVVSHGINIYEPDNERNIWLFHSIYKALRTGGCMITSFLTAPPKAGEKSVWNAKKINADDLQLQKILLQDLLNIHWQGMFSQPAEITEILKRAGFINFEVQFDSQKMLPTILAYKS